MKIKEILRKQIEILKENDIEDASLKARILLAFTIGKQKEYLITHDDELTEEVCIKYRNYIKRILDHEPIQYITGRQEFMKLEFFVNENVLVPRADTEILVEEAMQIIKENKLKTVLDLCTGSGAIAVSIAKYLPNAKVYASDISKKALEVAKINAENNDVADRIKFIKSDLFEKLEGMKFDIIVSNPPYIKTSVIKTLDEEVQNEPIIALDGGKDGLKFYRQIVEEAYSHLKYESYLCFEIGYDQKEEVMQIIEQAKVYSGTYCKKDLYGNDRVIVTKVQ